MCHQIWYRRGASNDPVKWEATDNNLPAAPEPQWIRHIASYFNEDHNFDVLDSIHHQKIFAPAETTNLEV